MRIGVDARPLSDPLNGIGRVLSELLGEACRLGDDWFLYSDRPFGASTPLGLNASCVAGANRLRLVNIAYSQLIFPRWAARDRIDVYWSPRHHLPLAVRKSVPEVVTIHDTVWRRFPETMSRRRVLAERVLMPASIRRADLVVAVSEFTKREIIDLVPDASDKIIVIPSAASHGFELGADSRDFSRGTGDSPYFLFVGTNEPRKNLGRLLRAHEEYYCHARNPVPLWIAGPPGWKSTEMLRSHGDEAGAERLKWLGYVEEERLVELYRDALCLVLPSLYEGFGLPILEAMAVGTPVITSNCAAMPEVAGNAAMFVEPTSVMSIAAALTRIATDQDLRASLSERGLQQTRRYSWRKSAVRLVEAMHSIAGG